MQAQETIKRHISYLRGKHGHNMAKYVESTCEMMCVSGEGGKAFLCKNLCWVQMLHPGGTLRYKVHPKEEAQDGEREGYSIIRGRIARADCFL